MNNADAPNHRRAVRGFGWLLITAGFLICGYCLTLGWNRSILDLHGFRQSQTAITAYYLAQEGFSLDYETPVLGKPWAIPFEFPFFQYLAALVTWTGTMELDQAGRLVSIAFWVGCLLPLHLLLKERVADPLCRWGVVLVAWSSPTYLFWSRCFLMESCALFFSLFYLWLFIRTIRAGSLSMCFWTLLIGIMAALIKATTFLIVAVPCVLFFLLIVRGQWTDGGKILRSALCGGAMLLLPILGLAAWTTHADNLREENPLGRYMVSSNLQSWNYGTLAQKCSWSTWKEISRKESLLGAPRGSLFGLIIVTLLAALLYGTRYRLEILVLLAAFTSGPLVFTNLFFRHEYYYYEIDIYLEIALGLAVLGLTARLSSVWQLPIQYLAWALLFLAGILDYHRTLLPVIEATPFASELRRELAPLSHAGKKQDVLLVYGHDWNSSLPYYSGRKSIMAADWFSNDSVESSISKLSPDEHIAAVIIKGPLEQDLHFVEDKIARFNLNPVPVKTSWGDYYLRRSP